jgi:hypothetical protein
MYKPLILLFGMVLSSLLPTSAQTPAPEILQTQDRITPIVSMVRTVWAPSLAASFLSPENLRKPVIHFSYLFAGAEERGGQGLEGLRSLSPMHQVKTLFLTQSMLPLVQLWGGRLRLDGFTSTLYMQNVQLGPSAAGGLLDFRPSRQGYLGGPRSVGLYGVSVSFHFGRDAQVGRPTQIWQCLARMVGAAR